MVEFSISESTRFSLHSNLIDGCSSMAHSSSNLREHYSTCSASFSNPRVGCSYPLRTIATHRILGKYPPGPNLSLSAIVAAAAACRHTLRPDRRRQIASSHLSARWCCHIAQSQCATISFCRGAAPFGTVKPYDTGLPIMGCPPSKVAA